MVRQHYQSDTGSSSGNLQKIKFLCILGRALAVSLDLRYKCQTGNLSPHAYRLMGTRSTASMAIVSRNPATGEILRTFEPLTEEELERRLQLAAETFVSWRETSFAARPQP